MPLGMRHYAYPKRRSTCAPACLGPGGSIVLKLANDFLPVVDHHEEAHEDKPAEASASAWGTADRLASSAQAGAFSSSLILL